MDYDEPPSNFRSLDKVRILLQGTHHLVATVGPCESLSDFDKRKNWHYIDFGDKPKLGIIIHDLQPEGILIESGRRGGKARLFYSQLIVYVDGWTISVPEYSVEKIASVRSWRHFKRSLDFVRKLAGSFKK